MYVTKIQLELVDYVNKFTGQFIKSVLELPSIISYLRLITSDFKVVDVDQSVVMLESLLNIQRLTKRVVISLNYVKKFIP